MRIFHIMNVPYKGRGDTLDMSFILNTSQIIAYKDRPKYILFSPPLAPDTYIDKIFEIPIVQP